MASDLEITPFDAADYLDSEEAQIAFLNDALCSGHSATIANAVGAVARAKSRANGMGDLAQATGIKRQTLNKSLGPKGNPTVETLFPVLQALGLRMMVIPAAKAGMGKAGTGARGHARR
jgi:probable addiction module antidote protein